jgi:uncharacterized membrane protein
MDSKNVLLAAAFAGLAMSATVHADSTTKKDAQSSEGQCYGVNSCKGTSACHSEQNSCAGQNTCKAKGWIKMTEKACKDKKGSFKKS